MYENLFLVFLHFNIKAHITKKLCFVCQEKQRSQNNPYLNFYLYVFW